MFASGGTQTPYDVSTTPLNFGSGLELSGG